MHIAVCVKRVADTSEVELAVAADGSAFDQDDFGWELNEWDQVAVETALRLREKHGGTVSAWCVGDKDDEEVLRRALAMGCDHAELLCDESFSDSDALGVARVLAAALAAADADLILCGAVAADTAEGVIGGLLAALLDLPMVPLATAMDVADGVCRVRHEVEDGLERVREVTLPALVTVQTGLCTPRYVSIRGIRKVSGVEIPQRGAEELGLARDQVGSAAAKVVNKKSSLPERGGGAEILAGSDEEKVARLVELIRQHGGLS